MVCLDERRFYDTHGFYAMDGLVYSDRTPQVDYWQVRKVYRPSRLRSGHSPSSRAGAYGAYELARYVVEGLKANVPALATHLAKDAGAFDPANPDPPEKVETPASPATGA